MWAVNREGNGYLINQPKTESSEGKGTAQQTCHSKDKIKEEFFYCHSVTVEETKEAGQGIMKERTLAKEQAHPLQLRRGLGPEKTVN